MAIRQQLTQDKKTTECSDPETLGEGNEDTHVLTSKQDVFTHLCWSWMRMEVEEQEIVSKSRERRTGSWFC
jgi:hypothetical protein